MKNLNTFRKDTLKNLKNAEKTFTQHLPDQKIPIAVINMIMPDLGEFERRTRKVFREVLEETYMDMIPKIREEVEQELEERNIEKQISKETFWVDPLDPNFEIDPEVVANQPRFDFDLSLPKHQKDRGMFMRANPQLGTVMEDQIFKITNVSRKKYEKLKKELLRDLVDGKDLTGGKRNLQKTVMKVMGNEKNMSESLRIARTESMRASNMAQKQTYDMSPEIKGYEWITVMTGNTRLTHLEVNGEIRQKGEYFSNGLQYPLDPSGAPSEVINCRCTAAPVLEDDFDSLLEDSNYKKQALDWIKEHKLNPSTLIDGEVFHPEFEKISYQAFPETDQGVKEAFDFFTQNMMDMGIDVESDWFKTQIDFENIRPSKVGIRFDNPIVMKYKEAVVALSNGNVHVLNGMNKGMVTMLNRSYGRRMERWWDQLETVAWKYVGGKERGMSQLGYSKNGWLKILEEMYDEGAFEFNKYNSNEMQEHMFRQTFLKLYETAEEFPDFDPKKMKIAGISILSDDYINTRGTLAYNTWRNSQAYNMSPIRNLKELELWFFDDNNMLVNNNLSSSPRGAIRGTGVKRTKGLKGLSPSEALDKIREDGFEYQKIEAKYLDEYGYMDEEDFKKFWDEIPEDNFYKANNIGTEGVFQSSNLSTSLQIQPLQNESSMKTLSDMMGGNEGFVDLSEGQYGFKQVWTTDQHDSELKRLVRFSERITDDEYHILFAEDPMYKANPISWLDEELVGREIDPEDIEYGWVLNDEGVPVNNRWLNTTFDGSDYDMLSEDQLAILDRSEWVENKKEQKKKRFLSEILTGNTTVNDTARQSPLRNTIYEIWEEEIDIAFRNNEMPSAEQFNEWASLSDLADLDEVKDSARRNHPVGKWLEQQGKTMKNLLESDYKVNPEYLEQLMELSESIGMIDEHDELVYDDYNFGEFLMQQRREQKKLQLKTRALEKIDNAGYIDRMIERRQEILVYHEMGHNLDNTLTMDQKRQFMKAHVEALASDWEQPNVRDQLDEALRKGLLSEYDEGAFSTLNSFGISDYQAATHNPSGRIDELQKIVDLMEPEHRKDYLDRLRHKNRRFLADSLIQDVNPDQTLLYLERYSEGKGDEYWENLKSLINRQHYDPIDMTLEDHAIVRIAETPNKLVELKLLSEMSDKTVDDMYKLLGDLADDLYPARQDLPAFEVPGYLKIDSKRHRLVKVLREKQTLGMFMSEVEHELHKVGIIDTRENPQVSFEFVEQLFSQPLDFDNLDQYDEFFGSVIPSQENLRVDFQKKPRSEVIQNLKDILKEKSVKLDVKTGNKTMNLPSNLDMGILEYVDKIGSLTHDSEYAQGLYDRFIKNRFAEVIPKMKRSYRSMAAEMMAESHALYASGNYDQIPPQVVKFFDSVYSDESQVPFGYNYIGMFDSMGFLSEELLGKGTVDIMEISEIVGKKNAYEKAKQSIAFPRLLTAILDDNDMNKLGKNDLILDWFEQEGLDIQHWKDLMAQTDQYSETYQEVAERLLELAKEREELMNMTKVDPEETEEEAEEEE